MRGLAVLASLAIAVPARADTLIAVDPPPPPTMTVPVPWTCGGRPHELRLSYQFGVGKLPLDGRRIIAVSLLGLEADVRAIGDWHLFGTYSWAMLDDEHDAPDANRIGSAHRLDAGLRRDVLDLSRKMARGFVALEAGGGVGWLGSFGAVPHALAGVRLGFDIESDEIDAGSTRTFGFELLVRATAVPDGVGLGFALALNWGD
jgi:hypothetical protein